MLLTLKILLILAATVILLLLICIVMPLGYEISLRGRQPDLQFKFLCRNPFMLIETQHINRKTASILLIFNHPVAPGAKKKSSSAHRASPTRDKQKTSSLLVREALGDRALLARGLKFLAAVWKNIKPRHLNINACIGFSEPHYTGWMLAIAALLQANNSCYTIHIEGNWLESGLDGEIYLAGKFIPALIIGQVIKLLLSSEIRAYYGIRRRIATAQV